MKRLRFHLLGGLFLSLASSVFAQQPKPVETQWPSITAEMFRITRLENNRAAVIFNFVSSASAPETTLIANKLIREPDEAGMQAFEAASSYSIEAGKLMDEFDEKKYSRSEQSAAGKAMPVDSAHKLHLPPSSGFLIGLVFDCPPINMDEPPKKQSVSFQLPGLKQPITGVPLPREVGKPIQFTRQKEAPAPQ